MAKKKKRSLRSIVSLALAAALLAGTPMPRVSAAADDGIGQEVEMLEAEVAVLEADAPMARTLLTTVSTDIYADSQGLAVKATVGTTQKASVLGAKDFKIYKKVGSKWELVAVSDGGEALDCVSMSVTVHYGNAEKGETYKFTCVFYGNVDEYVEVEGESRTYKY